MVAWATALLATFLALTLFPMPALAQGDPSGAYKSGVSIEVPTYHGLEPDLGLTYDSSSGNGPLGVGWRISGLSEIRRAAPGKGAPGYDDNDIFFLDGMELIPCEQGMQSPSCESAIDNVDFEAYATKRESFQRIAFEMTIYGGRWHVWEKNGTKMTYEPGISIDQRPFEWELTKVSDTLGNEVTYTYRSFSGSSDTSERYVDSISYNGAEIKFYWEERPDTISYASGRGLVSMSHRLKTVDVLVGGERARAYALSYGERDSSTSRSMLSEVRQYGRDATLDASGTLTGGTALPPTTLKPVEGGAAGEWEHAAPADVGWGPQGADPTRPMFREAEFPWRSSRGIDVWKTPLHGDMDGDGRDDWVRVALATENDRDFHLRITTSYADAGENRMLTDALPWDFPVEPRSDPLSDALWDIGYTRPLITDVDGDGRDDVVLLINYAGPRSGLPTDSYVRILVAFSQGDGDFAYGPRAPEGVSPPYSPQPTNWEDHNDRLIDRPNNFGLARMIHCLPADANGDGRSDILCSYVTDDDRHFLGTALSRGNGRFDVHSTPTPTTGNPWPVSEAEYQNRPIGAGDTDGDGLDDAVLLDFCECPEGTPESELRYDLLTARSTGNGDYEFARQQTDWRLPQYYSEKPWLRAAALFQWFHTGDINGDGRADVVTGMKVEDAEPPMMRTATTQAGSPHFALHEQPMPREVHEAHLMSSGAFEVIGDANGDGKDDILDQSMMGAHEATECSKAYDYDHPVLTRIISNGDGTFRWPERLGDCQGSASTELDFRWDRELNTPSLRTFISQAADTNGDGKADFLSTYKIGLDLDNSPVTVHDTVSPHSGREADGWLPADVNGDGRQDYVYPYQVSPEVVTQSSNGTQAQRFYTLVAKAEGGYDHEVSPTEQTPTYRGITGNWKVSDANGDGTSDLVYVRKENDSLWVDTFSYRANGQWDTVFKQIGEANGTLSVLQWKAMDVDGDGKGDLVNVTREDDGTSDYDDLVVQTVLSRLDAQGNGWWESSTRSWSGTQLGNDVANFRPADVNGDGRMDLLKVYHPYNKSFEEPTLEAYTLRYAGGGEWDHQHFKWPNSPSDNHWGPYRPAQCQPIQDELERLEAQLRDVQEELQNAPPGAKPVLIKLINAINEEISEERTRLNECKAQFDSTPPFLADVLNWRLADVNADGSTDLIHPTPTEEGLQLHALVSGGSGEVWVRRWQDVDLGAHAGNAGWSDTRSWKVADVNADGRSDLVHPYEDGGGVRVDTVVSAGDASWEAKPQQAEPLPGNGDPNPTRWNTGDANGDGQNDLFRVDSASQEGRGARVSSLLSTAPLDLTAEVSNGTGSKTEISYAPSSAHPVRNAAEDCHLPVGFMRQSVSSITIRDGRGNADTTTYSYGCARWSYEERTFLGWEDVVSTHEAAANRPESVSRTRHEATDECGARLVDSTLEDAQGRTLARSQIGYGEPDTVLPYVCLPKSQTEQTFDQQTGASTKNLTEFGYDLFGNVTQIYEHGNPKLADGERTRVMRYPRAKDPYVVGLPSYQEIFADINEEGTPASRVLFCYDYDDGCQAPPSKGLLTKTKEWNNKEDRYHETTFQYDQFGNQTKVTDANGHATTIPKYDETYNIFPEKICNALDQCTEQKWDPVIGQVEQSTDPNGNTTTHYFDALARPILTKLPNGGEVERSYLDFGDPQNQRVREVAKDAVLTTACGPRATLTAWVELTAPSRKETTNPSR